MITCRWLDLPCKGLTTFATRTIPRTWNWPTSSSAMPMPSSTAVILPARGCCTLKRWRACPTTMTIPRSVLAWHRSMPTAQSPTSARRSSTKACGTATRQFNSIPGRKSRTFERPARWYPFRVPTRRSIVWRRACRWSRILAGWKKSCRRQGNNCGWKETRSITVCRSSSATISWCRRKMWATRAITMTNSSCRRQGTSSVWVP
mmetsp:Transcript_28614/g.80670  ORF Transcript_28614/g.80670 Transcript_28614/m.80670 type:complete len:204 (-) Transcript_28614:1660-2271(-)